MTTATVAVEALIKVAHDTFIGLTPDPTYPTLYANMVYEKREPFFIHDNINTTYFYKATGQAVNQGLGVASQWRTPRIRVDVLTNTYDETEKAFEALRSAWITDFNVSSPTGAVGSGYLRATGGIKDLIIGESQGAPWDDKGLVFRRIADIQIMIGD